jgi:hypothetical protein
MTAESVVVGGLWGTDQEQDRSSVIRFLSVKSMIAISLHGFAMVDGK